MSSPIPLSILDLALIGEGESTADALHASVALARKAEELGYERVWYAEHHNMKTIASSATAVLIAHVAANTERIRLGSGGVMLPNHAPLTIAEQFGTLAELHPGRIDLGLGRAPGTDGNTLRALRRDPMSAESFPQDVLELQGYLTGETQIPHVHATPGHGTNVPLYILGSSLFGAQLAAQLGLPYAFASHFAPAALQDAVRVYRERFQPSAQLDEPYVIAGVNVIAADDAETAQRQFAWRRRTFARGIFSRPGQRLSDEQVDALLRSPQAGHVDEMLKHTAIGEPDAVRAYLEEFRTYADADELIVAHQADSVAGRLRSVELLAEAMTLAPR
ncbi:LLM class flavin-dependent oxidoreductase [Conexibacter sp. SYSU D00693]|uniref:LLM class flavin-dependent oxidoreductase n=1 Tax=Conexibacter sp. SYSU D00693 TaxID=2812560 RepID=UPI00196A70A9|nr:LLM class flavin-dependent oxidoreductase [Conexibacter sp. SYSU D00693]